MRAKPFVFVGDQRVEITRIDAPNEDGQSPASFASRIRTQQPVLAVEYLSGELNLLAERHGTE
jgi:hypothetical protein